MKSIYLDHAATSPLRPAVREAMAPLLEGVSGNPSSVHRWGREARAALEKAREHIAALLRVTPREVIFTRGGTEAINLAILGTARSARSEGGPSLLLRSALEHSAVREPMDELARLGHRVEVIAVNDEGHLDEDGFASALAHFGASRRLAAFQWVNHETGILLPIGSIADRCAAEGVPLLVDAVQAAGRIPIDLSETPTSLLSLSGHKLGGPRGMGVLVARKGVELHPLLFGGGQEGGLRPGTEDVAGAVGFARAFELAVAEMAIESERLAGLRRTLEVGLRTGIPELRIHGERAERAPHILSIGVPGIPRDLLPNALDVEGVGVSAGSACRSGSTEVSPVMVGLYGEEAHSFAPLRLSLGWNTTQDELNAAIPRIVTTVNRGRGL